MGSEVPVHKVEGLGGAMHALASDNIHFGIFSTRKIITVLYIEAL